MVARFYCFSFRFLHFQNKTKQGLKKFFVVYFESFKCQSREENYFVNPSQQHFKFVKKLNLFTKTFDFIVNQTYKLELMI